jgi:hypothetical protein
MVITFAFGTTALLESVIPSRQRGIRRLRVQEASQQKRERSEADEPQQRQAARSVNGPPTGLHREKYPHSTALASTNSFLVLLKQVYQHCQVSPPDHLPSPQRGLQIAHGAVLNVFSESLIYEVAGIGSVHCPDAVRDLLERERKLASLYPERRSLQMLTKLMWSAKISHRRVQQR